MVWARYSFFKYLDPLGIVVSTPELNHSLYLEALI